MFRRHVIPFILAGVLPALALAALVILIFRPFEVRRDRVRAPEWLKRTCLSGKVPWRNWHEIIIHHTAGEKGDLASVDRWHRQRKWRCAGYHFLIGNGTLSSGDGEIEVGPRWPTQDNGAHCSGRNDGSIGIGLVGNFDIQTKHPGDTVPTPNRPTEAQMTSLVQLTAYLAVRYDIPIERIYVHREAALKPTVCPGKYFPIDDFRRRLRIMMNRYRADR